MKISVLLCTYNRSQSLSKALESVAAQSLPESVEWEVLVVDNNSRDQTREVVENFCRRRPGHIRYVFEPRQGLSYARNSGVREARGDVLAFVDDDVTVDPKWLDNLTAPLRDGKWAGSGGLIIPPQTFTPPSWLAYDGPYNMLGPLCAHFDLGDKPHELDQPPYGTNMAFRKQMFEKYGEFRNDLDRCGKNTMSNGDTEFGRRLLAAGERLWYAPSAVVYHPVPEGRLRKEYFLAWWFDYGRANMREIGKRPDIWGIPRHYLSALKYGIHLIPVRTLSWAFTFNPHLRFYQKCQVWKTAGELAEIYSLRSVSKESENEVKQSIQ
jgi:glycosyltransferase involved in cell wall biosynthesis